MYIYIYILNVYLMYICIDVVSIYIYINIHYALQCVKRVTVIKFINDVPDKTNNPFLH